MYDDFFKELSFWGKHLGHETVASGSEIFAYQRPDGRGFPLHRVRPSLTSEEVETLEATLGVVFPEELREFYLTMNGVEIFEEYHVIASYFTNDKSIVGSPSIIAITERLRYKGMPEHLLCIGYSRRNYTEVLPLIINIEDNKIIEGDCEDSWQEDRCWDSLPTFLASEMKRVGKHYDHKTGERLFLQEGEPEFLRKIRWSWYRKLAYQLGWIRDPNDDIPIL